MTNKLQISVGQQSTQGRKAINQDFHGLCTPLEPLLSAKGVAIAIADGISSSDVSQMASETAIKSFLSDYYCTPETWSVKTSAQRVLIATHSWLYSQTRRSQYRYNNDKGYVCTFSGLIIKSTTAHLFHVGDARIYRLSEQAFEPLTEDHRQWIDKETHYLSRALGAGQQLDIDYRAMAINIGDIFVLVTDGIYESVSDQWMAKTIQQNDHDLTKAAEIIVEQAYQQGSHDNLTIQIVRIDNLPEQKVGELYKQLATLPLPPQLEARMHFDGYEILRDVYISSRSHVFLARDKNTNEKVIIKTPSIDKRDDEAYLERFLMEEWIAKRIRSPHVLKPCQPTRQRHYLYLVTEFIDGQTLAQWMIDHPQPDVETVRAIVEQIAKGLQCFHRQEMLHQDLRPANIMIDRSGTVKIIDFGSAIVAGLTEITHPEKQAYVLGTAQYTAPEYFLGEYGTRRSDLYALAVITYQLLSGRLPYNTDVAKARTKAAQKRLVYRSVLDDKREIPAWVDQTLKKALHPNPMQRYAEISEYLYDLRHPNKTFLTNASPPLIERNPVLFWQGISLILFLIILALLAAKE